MNEATIVESSELRDTLGPRFRLSGLMLLVLGAGLSLGVMSRAHLLTTVGRSFWESPVTRWLGVAMAPIGVALSLTLAIQVFGRLNPPRASEKTSVADLLAARGAGAAGTAPDRGVVAPSSRTLQPVVDKLASWPHQSAGAGHAVKAFAPRSWADDDRVRPGNATGQSSSGSTANTSGGLVQELACGLGGILIVAELMIIPYLVLIAIEAVENAKLHPGEASGGLLTSFPGPPMPRGLADRLDATIPEIRSCPAGYRRITAAWLSSSLRRTHWRSGDSRFVA